MIRADLAVPFPFPAGCCAAGAHFPPNMFALVVALGVLHAAYAVEVLASLATSMYCGGGGTRRAVWQLVAPLHTAWLTACCVLYPCQLQAQTVLLA